VKWKVAQHLQEDLYIGLHLERDSGKDESSMIHPLYPSSQIRMR
jgi:hypothetical protein